MNFETAPGTPQLSPAPDFRAAGTGHDFPTPDVGDAGTGLDPHLSEQLSAAPDVGDAGTCLESRLAEQLSPAPGVGAASPSIISVPSVAGTPTRKRKGRTSQWTPKKYRQKGSGKVFDVQELVGFREGASGNEYKVKWQDTWEPECNLNGATKLIDAFRST